MCLLALSLTHVTTATRRETNQRYKINLCPLKEFLNDGLSVGSLGSALESLRNPVPAADS